MLIISVFICFFELIYLCCEIDKLDEKLNKEVAQIYDVIGKRKKELIDYVERRVNREWF